DEAFLIIRTDVGQKVIDHALKQKYIEITVKEPNLSEMKNFINKKKRKNFKNLIGKDNITAKYLQLNVDELKDLLE
ncbi:MAG: hypothetical protein MUP85_15135, partial [Candidatus Lokiarchaeota archaeon]|nr:hypothetical protein [Candidatus Lokiarchaeota archaeon]